MPTEQKTEEFSVTDAFSQEAEHIESTATQLAEHIVIEEDKIDQLETGLKTRKEKLAEAKEQLASLLMQAGLESIKLESGLNPKVRINRRYYRQAGLGDEELFAWLAANQLDGIIKPTVHFGTLQSAMKEYEEQGNTPPENIFNTVDQRTVTMYGKSKFLERKNNGT